MDGLTNIIAKIHEQNDAECQNVLASAKEKAEKILADAKIEAADAAKTIDNDTKNKCSIISSKAVSTADLEYKRAILSKKSEILDKAVADALSAIKNSSDDVYFGYIEKLLLSNALSGNGVLKMSENDLKRMPDDFEKKMNAKLTDGKSITVSAEGALFDSGFVIEYPEMRVDCTFASLVNDKLDEIRDELSRVLFA